MISFLLIELGSLFILQMIPSTVIDSQVNSTFRDVPPLFEEKMIGDKEHMVRTSHHPYISSELVFSASKNSEIIRIFCLGGSAAMGWPHELSQSYPSYLQQKLDEMFPKRSFEIVNLGASTYGSHRIKAILDEILHYEADLILLYCGNNEFLEPHLYRFTPLPRPWSYSALARLIDYVWDSWRATESIPFSNHEARFMLDIALGRASPLARNEDQKQWVQGQFIRNIEAMIGEINAAGIPIYVLNVPTNAKDWVPHKSVHAEGMPSTHWQEARRIGANLMKANTLTAAIHSLETCLVIDSQHAETYFDLGSSYLKLNDLSSATEYFQKAIDKDAYPFRCPTPFNKQLQKLCEKKEIPMVDIIGKLRKHSSVSILGDETLVDHVHPTAASNQIIANAVIEMLMEQEFIPKTSIQYAIPQLEIDHSAEHNLTIYQHLFLIFRVLRQFDKLPLLLQKIESFDFDTKKSSAFMALRDQLNRTIAITDPYHQLIKAQEYGTADELFSDQEQRKILDNYVDLCTSEFSPAD